MHPNMDTYHNVKSFIMPLLEGSAFNELTNTNAIDYSSLSVVLK